jgi:hypothetical protein
MSLRRCRIRIPHCRYRSCGWPLQRRERVPSPGPGDPSDPWRANSDHRPFWRVREWRQHGVWGDADPGEIPKERRCAAVCQGCLPVDDERQIHPDLVPLFDIEAHGHTRVALDVADLRAVAHASDGEVVPVEADPDDRHLRTPVRVRRMEMTEAATGERGAGSGMQGHGRTELIHVGPTTLAAP